MCSVLNHEESIISCSAHGRQLTNDCNSRCNRPNTMLWLLRVLTNICVHTLIKTHTHTHINKLLLRNQNRHSPRKCMLDISGQVITQNSRTWKHIIHCGMYKVVCDVCECFIKMSHFSSPSAELGQLTMLFAKVHHRAKST